MNFKPLYGYIDFPFNEKPGDHHLGLSFDYEYAGKRMGEQVSLLIHSWIIDHRGNVYSRKGEYMLPRVNAIDAITKHIKTHLTNMGVDDMSGRRLMRDFEVGKEKSIPYDVMVFSRHLM